VVGEGVFQSLLARLTPPEVGVPEKS